MDESEKESEVESEKDPEDGQMTCNWRFEPCSNYDNLCSTLIQRVESRSILCSSSPVIHSSHRIHHQGRGQHCYHNPTAWTSYPSSDRSVHSHGTAHQCEQAKANNSFSTGNSSSSTSCSYRSLQVSFSCSGNSYAASSSLSIRRIK